MFLNEMFLRFKMQKTYFFYLYSHYSAENSRAQLQNSFQLSANTPFILFSLTKNQC